MPNGDKGDATRHEEAALPPSLDDAGEAEEAGQQPQEHDVDCVSELKVADDYRL